VLWIRAAIYWSLELLLGLVGTIALFAGFAMLGASLLSLAMSRLAQGAPWLTEVFIGAAVMGGTFLGGGALLAAIKARSVARRESVLSENEVFSPAWMWPALVPTLLLPAFAVAASWKLVLLWREILIAFERMGLKFELARVNDWANWAVLPIAGALFVPCLETVSAVLLVAMPPLLLLALIARAQGFRMNAQRLVILQAMFVGASLVGSNLFSRLAARLESEIRRLGGPEAPMMLEALAKGRDALAATAWGHAAVLAGYGVCLWVLMAAQDAQRAGAAWVEGPVVRPGGAEDVEGAAGPKLSGAPEATVLGMLIPNVVTSVVTPPAVPAVVGPTQERVSDLPPSSRRSFEEVLAQFRARHGGATTAPMPVHARGESSAAEALPLGGALAVDLASWRRTARTALQTILLGMGALMLTFGALQLLSPRPRFSEASPAPGGSLSRPPGAIEVRFTQALNPAATISLHRTMGPGGDYSAAGPVVEHTRALSRDDVSGRSLRLDPLPPLTGGVYRVDWRVMAAGRTDITYGHYFFAVGASMPEDLKGPQGRPFAERDARQRGNRAALLSGVVLVALALLVPGRVLRD